MSISDSLHLPLINSQDPDRYEHNQIFEENSTPQKTSLPPIASKPTAANTSNLTKASIVIPETPIVIATKDQSKYNTFNQASSIDEWKRLQLQASSGEVQKTKLEWENDIARHILSLYATTNALKNIKESNSLLDFVGEKDKTRPPPVYSQEEEDDDVQEDPYRMNITTNTPSFANQAENVESFNVNDSREGVDEDEERRDGGAPPKRKRKKKGKRASNKTEGRSTKDLMHHMTKEEQDHRNQQFINEIIDKIENSMSLSKEKDRYRITNAIKTKDGKEIVVRGSPRCFPIWFVSSGDVFVDWTNLVGGKQLQSHLSVLYENHYYDEYVNILQTMLLTFWREKRFGKEEFSLGSFGKSESAGNTPHSGGKNRTSSSKAKGSSRAASSSSSFSRPVSSSSKGQEKLSRVNTANSEFSRHYGSSKGDAQVNQGPQVSFYESLLAKEIDSSIRDDIEEKVEQFNAQREQQRLPSSSIDQSLHQAQHPASDVAFTQLTVKDLESFWKQLILTTIAIGILCIERKQHDKGMKFFIKADEFSQNDDMIPVTIERKEFRAHVKDAMSYYFFKKEKFIAALAYSSQALEVFEMRGTNLEAIATCLLHIAATYSQMGKFKDSHKVLFQFLAMVENGRLALEDATPKQLCLVAVGYHNLAVIQLKLAMPDLACKSSQNARKIARLCLAYSNRWIDIFQYTHEIAISDMKYELQTLTIDQITPQQMFMIKELAEALFSIDSQA